MLETRMLKEKLRAALSVVEEAEDTLHGVKLDTTGIEAA
jgi:hypothetical protein